MLLIISKFSPDVFLRLSQHPQLKNSVVMAADHICNFFTLLSTMVIFEKEDEKAKGFLGMQKSCEKPFEAY
jgi:hypothetical protein